LDQSNLEQAKEIVGVGGSSTTGNSTLGLDDVGSFIGVELIEACRIKRR
jgi:hypothetical protein